MQEFGFWLYKLQGLGLALLVKKFGSVVQAADLVTRNCVDCLLALKAGLVWLCERLGRCANTHTHTRKSGSSVPTSTFRIPLGEGPSAEGGGDARKSN
jgi:hypothetical protein